MAQAMTLVWTTCLGKKGKWGNARVVSKVEFGKPRIVRNKQSFSEAVNILYFDESWCYPWCSLMFFPLDGRSIPSVQPPLDCVLEAQIRRQCRWRQLLIRLKTHVMQMDVLQKYLGPRLQGRVALLLRVKHYLGLEAMIWHLCLNSSSDLLDSSSCSLWVPK